MPPHSYTIDSYSKSQDLAAEILAASSPIQISAACNSLHSFLRHVSPDQSRWFFSVAFPTLIAKVFGFDDSSNQASSGGWIDVIMVANDVDLGRKVFDLLSPDGALMSLISAVDRLSLVKYMFPTERLPEWVKYMLSSEQNSRVVQEICPLFRDRVKEEVIKGSEFQVQLNVFDYFIFWFAYYPVCRGKSETVRSVSVQKVSKFKLKNWTSSLPVFSSFRRGAESKTECNLYMWLLYAYLSKFVPAYDLNVHQPYRSSIRHYPSNYDGSVVMRSEFVVSTFVHFWLVDNDFSPLSVNVCKSFGLSFLFRSVLGEMPPVSGLGELVKLFVNYVNMSFVLAAEGPDLVEYTDSPRWKALNPASFHGSMLTDVSVVHVGVMSPTSFNVMIQRPLYRFILRTFLFCPMETSIKNISEVFSVWITYIEPWKMSSNDFSEFDALMDGSLKDKKAKEKQQLAARGYSSGWSDYVLSNYLFYSSLAMHFIGFAHKFLHADPETIVQMMLKVMSVLTASRELTELIKKMDAVFHSKAIGSGKSMLSSLYKYVPSIREQLQDWEDGLCESDADGSFLHDNWNRDLRLFSDGEDGGQQLLQLFILRAEYELQTISGDQSNGIKCIDSLKSQISCIFGSHVASPQGTTPGKERMHETAYDRHELFTPRKVGNATNGDVKYRGDWMRRPASGDEIAWLADLLVRLSAWLNENLGLIRAHQTGARSGSSVNISNVSENKVYDTTDTVKMVLLSVGSWLMMLGLGVVDLMRKHGLRINLRFLASMKVLLIGFVILVLGVLSKCFGLA